MNSLEYEVDSMSGLMPQILALTAPPGTRDNNRQPFQSQNSTNASCSQSTTNGNGQSKTGEAGLAAHPYFRRPGRGHNHDCCDACSEGGDLICCDLCPASFHLTCHDPPLDEDEIPTGEWACHQCRMGAQKDDDKTQVVNGKSTKGSKALKKKDESKHKQDLKVFTGGRELQISDTPLYTLIKAAAVVNPTQFTLPYEMTLPANFPGEPKETFYKKNGSRRGLTKKKPYELDNGLVPLPAKLCFQCNKSCRMGPLIPCDFCPLFYHLDCLDPPLTTPPMGRWMCPNHPEHHMDTMLTSHSLTERVKLWDRFTAPVDQDSVKLCFLQRCHRLNPPFRYKVKKALRSRLRVPSAIKAHYQDPPDLMPHLSPSQYLPFPPPFDQYDPSSSSLSQTTLSNIAPATPQNISVPPSSTEANATTFPESSQLPLTVKEECEMEVDSLQETKRSEKDTLNEPFLDSTKPTQEEKDQWLASVIHLQSSILRHMAMAEVPHSKKSPSDTKTEQCNGLTDYSPSPLTPLLDSRPNFLNGDLVSQESKSHKKCLEGISHASVLSHQPSSICSSGIKRNAHKTQKNKLSSISKAKQKRGSPTELLSDTLTSLGASLREKLEENHGLTLGGLEQSVVEVLAYERLKEILEPPKAPVLFSTPPLAARALLCPLVPDFRLKEFSPKQKYSSNPVPMVFRILNIGKGSYNHVNLELYGHCNYVSHHHACIIFDETTGHYELLNYSEFDTKVDGVTYNCDYTEKTISQAVPPPFLQHVKAIITKRKEEYSSRESKMPRAMNSRPGEDFVRCECRRESETASSKASKGSGWEGAAVLHHGSYIRFGCLKFVFSVVEEASKGDWAKDTGVIYEKFLKKHEEERKKEKEEREKKIKKEEKVAKS